MLVKHFGWCDNGPQVAKILTAEVEPGECSAEGGQCTLHYRGSQKIGGQISDIFRQFPHPLFYRVWRPDCEKHNFRQFPHFAEDFPANFRTAEQQGFVSLNNILVETDLVGFKKKPQKMVPLNPYAIADRSSTRVCSLSAGLGEVGCAMPAEVCCETFGWNLKYRSSQNYYRQSCYSWDFTSPKLPLPLPSWNSDKFI